MIPLPGSRRGGVDSPLFLFILSLFSLSLGGVIVWYTLARSPSDDGTADVTGRSDSLAVLPAAGIPLPASDVPPSRPVAGIRAEENPLSAARRNAIVIAAERVGPAVVSINVMQTQVVRASGPRLFNDFWNDFFFPRNYRREVQSLGSGFIVSEEGHILTNEHVVHSGEKITVSLEDGREVEASLLGSDRTMDLALLQIKAHDLPVASIGTSRGLLIGEWAIAIGNPFGYLLDDTQPTVTVGVISAIDRDIKLSRQDEVVYAGMIQTDASINPGNSGGPLVNSRGEVIGVNTFIFTQGGGSLGIGFAIPIERAKRAYNEILRYNKVLRPWVGIHPQDLTPSLRRGLNLEEHPDREGVIVADVDPGSSADQAGIHRGDVITRINAEPIRSAQDWSGTLLDTRVGQDLDLEIYRDGRPEQVRLAPGPLPTDTAPKTPVDFGLVLTDVTDAIRSQLGLRSPTGALILEVTDPGLSRDNGFAEYDVILKVNDIDIRTAGDAKAALDGLTRRRNSLVLERGGRMIYRSLLVG